MNTVRNIKFILFLLISAISANVLAEANPKVIVENATDQMLTELRANKDAIESDKTIVNGIVEKLLLPHFAYKTISRKVLGKYARKASDEQKQQFADAFKGYMVRFYSNAFAEYTDETVDVLDVPDFSKAKRVTIKTRLNHKASGPIPIDYKMQRSGESWKIIDVTIEGISLVISNRTQFGNSIKRDGLDTVIAKLAYKNKTVAE